jgi:hypothetical protein
VPLTRGFGGFDQKAPVISCNNEYGGCIVLPTDDLRSLVVLLLQSDVGLSMEAGNICWRIPCAGQKQSVPKDAIHGTSGRNPCRRQEEWPTAAV